MQQPSVNPITQQIQFVINQLASIPYTGTGVDAQPIISNLEQMQNELDRLEPSSGRVEPEEIRSRIAELRHSLRSIAQSVEKELTANAETYREQVGDQKDQFESLSDILQLQTNAPAYLRLSTYKQLAQVRDELSDINGKLMDLSGQVEHDFLQRKDLTDADHTDVFDKDPAPPTLTP